MAGRGISRGERPGSIGRHRQQVTDAGEQADAARQKQSGHQH